MPKNCAKSYFFVVFCNNKFPYKKISAVNPFGIQLKINY